MRFYFAGKTERDQHLAAILHQKGHAIAPSPPGAVLILPLPRSAVPSGMQLPSGQKIVCGLTGATFDTLADVHRWQVFRPLEDAQYLQENAALTAEDAIHLAAMHLTRALSDCHILVTGYGRIGKRLTELLRAAGAAVTVAARRKESRSEAGADSITIEEITGRLRETDVVFNTVPARIPAEETMCHASPGTLLVELSSTLRHRPAGR